MLDLRSAESELPAGSAAPLAEIADGLAAALDELRELSHGIHPAILSESGLVPALKALARRSTVPVTLDFAVPTRPPEPVEVAAYYVVSEALANTAKHAKATAIHVDAHTEGSQLHLTVADNGIGGAAAPTPGSGLLGLRDRVEAVGGTLVVTSPPGHGTSVIVNLPVPG